MKNNGLGDRIRYLRRMKKFTQQELSRLLKVSSSTIAMWENGQRDPGTSMLAELSKLFGVSVDWLLNGDEKSIQINVLNTENTITILGRNGIFKSYIVDDSKIDAIITYAETLSKDDNIDKKK